ncbi:hypothetical protein BZZ01_12785 [Nostocales cyanobacterium HT-58-2]|nr:hypothetical protein BZZ01_12785 [Nostocales cyanobacterium HT-58-2]
MLDTKNSIIKQKYGKSTGLRKFFVVALKRNYEPCFICSQIFGNMTNQVSGNSQRPFSQRQGNPKYD